MAQDCFNAYPPIRAVHLVIGGFQQDRGDHTGMDKLWRTLHYRYSGPRTLVLFLEWHDRVSSIARLIWRHAGEDGRGLRVTIAAYSWGVPTAVTLARHLRRLGIVVDCLVSSDGVYRWRWMIWRVIFRWPRIVVPPNVHRVVQFRQEMDWPSGHTLVAEDPQLTKIEEPILEQRGHRAMDEAYSFHLAAKSIAKAAQDAAMIGGEEGEAK